MMCIRRGTVKEERNNDVRKNGTAQQAGNFLKRKMKTIYVKKCSTYVGKAIRSRQTRKKWHGLSILEKETL